MDGAGNIFDRIEQKLSALGVDAGISDLQKAAGEYDARISNNPADLDSKMIDLELKVVMLARLLNASIDALEARGVTAAPAAAPATAASSPVQATQTSGPGKRVRRLRQNPATGIIEEIEDIVEDNVIVADNRARLGGGKGDGKKDGKKSVFIQACDDEPVSVAEQAKK